MRKTGFYLLGLVLGLVVMIVTTIPDGKTRIIACDVGQGDAILITKGQTQVLIDGGPSSEKVLSCLAQHVPFWDHTIELIVLTNTDFDHMNGLAAVIERYSLGKFVTADGVHESEALTHMASVASARQVVVSAVGQGDEIRVGSKDKLELRVLWPTHVESSYLAVFSDKTSNGEREQILSASAKRGELNERSVVLLLTEGNYRALLTGDAGDQAEKEMLAQGILSDVDYLKVGHHGSKYASTLEFLQVIMPEKAVISVGDKNKYGHPTGETLERLSKIGAIVKRTDREGEIVTRLNEVR